MNEEKKEEDEFGTLFVEEEAVIDKVLLKEAVIKYLKLTNLGEAILEKEFYELGNFQKVIVYLLARKILFIKKIIEKEEAGPTEIAQSIGLPPGSVKTVFHSDKYNLFKSVNRKHKIPNYAINKSVEILKNYKKIKQKISSPSAKRTTTLSKKMSEDETVKKVVSSINRTEFPKIYEMDKTLDKALYLLKIVKEKVGIDGLSSPQISYILTEIFRLSTSQESVSMSLMDQRLLVHRIEKKSDRGYKTYIYKIMKGGEDYLEEILKR